MFMPAWRNPSLVPPQPQKKSTTFMFVLPTNGTVDVVTDYCGYLAKRQV